MAIPKRAAKRTLVIRLPDIDYSKSRIRQKKCEKSGRFIGGLYYKSLLQLCLQVGINFSVAAVRSAIFSLQ
jgi:hypothetical protein